ncbi:hypothetical protein [Yersinia pekkanenii]|uniref:hypothetical protein n=1 Tax=Yersinia pekkanenii TaxID=1288385 RepID=UPI0009E32B23|nr:hypothetical protein [Yersinia pekkanenii]
MEGWLKANGFHWPLPPGAVRVATQAMLNAGFSGEMVTEKQMSNLISEALLTSLPEADNP